MSSCTCLWVDGRRVDDTHCPVHDTLTGVPEDEPDDSINVLRRRHAMVMEGHCWRCSRRLDGGACSPCGVGYTASAGGDSWAMSEWLLDWATPTGVEAAGPEAPTLEHDVLVRGAEVWHSGLPPELRF